MVKGTGIDVTDNQRFRNIENNDDFLSEIYSEHERLAAPTGRGRAASLARSFAAKEAILKALGCGLHAGSYWKDIEIKNDNITAVRGFPASIVRKESASKIFLSCSSSKHFTIAFILIE